MKERFVEFIYNKAEGGTIYNKCSKYSFLVTSDHTFEYAKCMIYSRTLGLKTLIDVGNSTKCYFQASSWFQFWIRGWETTCIFLSSGIPVLEFYVELVPSVTGLDLKSGYDNYVPESELVLETAYEHIPEPVQIGRAHV